MSIVYQNSFLQLEVVSSEVPWFKISLGEPENLLPQKQELLRKEILRVIDVLNQAMMEFFEPDKINIVTFGNALPEYYWYVIARFKNDSYFPEEMWGEKQREGEYVLKDLKKFVGLIKKSIMSPQNQTT